MLTLLNHRLRWPLCQLHAFKLILYFLTSNRCLSGKASSAQFNKYRKIPKISPGAYIFQRPSLSGLFLEGPIFGGLIYGGKFALQNRLG